MDKDVILMKNASTIIAHKHLELWLGILHLHLILQQHLVSHSTNISLVEFDPPRQSYARFNGAHIVRQSLSTFTSNAAKLDLLQLFSCHPPHI